MTDVDVVVVGGGAMGSAAAWQLARRGRSVRLLERFAPGHDEGASHGATRNFNPAYDESDYLDLVVEARELWDELAGETGTTLLDLVGLVNHGDGDRLRSVHAAHERHGVPSTLLSAGEARDRWRGLAFSGEVLFVPGGGRVRAADALVALRVAAEARGARFSYGARVRDIRVDGPDRVVVTTDDEEVTASRVVVAAGAWAPSLLAGLVPLPPLVVTQEQPVHLAVRDASAVWPSFNYLPDPSDDRTGWWPGPVYGMLTPGEGVKAGWHGTGPVTDPDRRSRRPEPGQLAALLRWADEWLPGADTTSVAPISCTYTTSPTSDFVLDRVGPVVAAAGFAGHGFKFTPAVGRVLADLVDGTAPPRRFSAAAQSALS